MTVRVKKVQKLDLWRKSGVLMMFLSLNWDVHTFLDSLGVFLLKKATIFFFSFSRSKSKFQFQTIFGNLGQFWGVFVNFWQFFTSFGQSIWWWYSWLHLDYLPEHFIPFWSIFGPLLAIFWLFWAFLYIFCVFWWYLSRICVLFGQ